MPHPISRTLIRLGLAGVIALPLAACGAGTGMNRGVEAAHQPVVSYSTFLYDVRTDGATMSQDERLRLAGWLDSLDIGYGDSIAVASGGMRVAPALHEDIGEVLGRRGMLVHEDASAAAGTPPPGFVRLIVRRTSASVPGCPEWRTQGESNLSGGTSSNFGCATNGNLAAMVANPEDLVRGQSTNSDLRTATSSRAIETYRTKSPTGAGDLKDLGGN